ncbi:MAG: ArsC family transcriptional regulator [Tissierellia bacterium]|nr:ArsC family transcriptional regulator [Tissierellia bacterium]
MALQIFGHRKSKDTRKAERFFKERGISYQFVDLREIYMSMGELKSMVRAAGGLEELLDPDTKERDAYAMVTHMVGEQQLDYIIEVPEVLKLPLVRYNGRVAVGADEKTWGEFARQERK